jgi:hypothetical protein
VELVDKVWGKKRRLGLSHMDFIGKSSPNILFDFPAVISKSNKFCSLKSERMIYGKKT